MNRNGYLIWLIVLTGMPWSLAVQSETLKIRHYQVQERYAFGLMLLKLALSKHNLKYTLIEPVDSTINEARGESEVVSGKMDLQFLSTTAEREAKMIPIKIPVYRGLLGLRLLLIKKARQEELSTITDINRLATLTGLHGTHWGDLPVYRANGLPVLTTVNYEPMFGMLIAGRGDYFHRGISEISGELARYQNDLAIADNVALFYPHPVYFFVSKRRPELAKLIEQGLQMALEDGSYRALFESEFRAVIKAAGLQNRTIIALKNPVLPDNTPPLDTSWWMPDFAPALEQQEKGDGKKGADLFSGKIAAFAAKAPSHEGYGL